MNESCHTYERVMSHTHTYRSGQTKSSEAGTSGKLCGSLLQSVAVCCSVLQCVAVCCSVLQSVAVCCSLLQCVAVCCSVLQCFAPLRIFAVSAVPIKEKIFCKRDL